MTRFQLTKWQQTRLPTMTKTLSTCIKVLLKARLPQKTTPSVKFSIPLVDIEKCVSCDLCSLVCSTDCIELQGAKAPQKPGSMTIDYSRCTSCGDCMLICPTSAINCMVATPVVVSERKQLVKTFK